MSNDNTFEREGTVTGVTVKLHPPDTDYCTEVLLAIAEALNTDATELPPIRESVEPEVINTVLQDSDVRQHDRTEELSFEYADMEVTVYSDKSLHLEPLH